MTPVVERLIDVGAGKVQVDSSGSGPDFVIIHSLLTGPEAFDGLASALSDGMTVHRVYLPGFGATTPLATHELSVADLADLVADAMAELECDEDTVVLGNGLGSFVALSLAVAHGASFGPLIACNTGPAFPEDRKGAFRMMSDLAIDGGMSAVVEVAVSRIFPPAYLEAHPDAPAQRAAVLEAIDPGAFAAACRALASLDLSDQLATIANPTLVVVGEIDQTTPPAMGKAVADAIPDAAVSEIAGCGHCPQLEKPDELAAIVRRFLTGLAG